MNRSKNLVQEAPLQNDCRSQSAKNELQEYRYLYFCVSGWV
jgi:hypothetical protein